jgi:hypothetical protein
MIAVGLAEDGRWLPAGKIGLGMSEDKITWLYYILKSH